MFVPKKFLILLVCIIYLFSLTYSISAECETDQYISLAYPNELFIASESRFIEIHDGTEKYKKAEYKSSNLDQNFPSAIERDKVYSTRPPAAPPNKGYIWIPKEACGKSVDLLIALHGWRSLKYPTDSVYLNIPGQETKQKEFDTIIRSAINSKTSVPIIVAAPMDDRGPHEEVFQDAFDINTYISRINILLIPTSTTIARVSLLGHSNANCGGSLAKSAMNLQGYPLYLYASADGTCGATNFFEITNHRSPEKNGQTENFDLLKSLKQKNTIVFHMHQNDVGAAKAIKSVSPGSKDAAAQFPEKFVDTWMSNDGRLFTYKVSPSLDEPDKIHGRIPGDLLQEILPRFFSPTGKPILPTTSSTPSKATPQIQGGTTNAGLLTSQNCAINQRCRDIDTAWNIFGAVLGLHPGEVWVPPKNAWKTFAGVYNPQPLNLPPTAVGTGATPPAGTTSASCKIISNKISPPNSGKSALSGINFKHYGKLDIGTSSCARSSPSDLIILHDGGAWGGKDCAQRDVVKDLIHFWTVGKEKEGKTMLSSHYFICGNGEIYQMVSEDLAGRHAGCPDGFGKSKCPISYVNSRSIGIDLQDYSSKEPTNIYSDAQLKSLKKLLDDIGQRNKIPIDDTHVLAHFEVVKQHHDDPLKGFRWELIGLNDHRKLNGPHVIPGIVTDSELNGPHVIPGIVTDSDFPPTDSFPTPKTEEVGEGDDAAAQMDLKQVTITSSGNNNRKTIIVTSPSFDKSQDAPFYFYFGGSGSSPDSIIKAVKPKIEQLFAQQPNAVLVIPQIPSTSEGTWMNNQNGNYVNLFDEVLTELNYGDSNTISSITFGAHSFGGAAIKNILTLVQNLPLTKLVFLDACSGNWCQEAQKYVDEKNIEMVVVQEKIGFGTVKLTEDILRKQLTSNNIHLEFVSDSHYAVFTKYFEKIYS